MTFSLSPLEAAGIAFHEVREEPFSGRATLTFSVRGEDALTAWHLLAGGHHSSRAWPVITGERPFSADGANRSPVTVDRDAGALLAEWFRGQFEDTEEDLEAEIGPLARTPGEAGRHAAAVPPAEVFTDLEALVFSHRNRLTREGLPRVFLALVPDARPWEVPAWLGFGGYNGCPVPAEHLAVLRRWNERYGLRTVGVTGDVLELAVDRPPQTAAQALLLATEQFSYCPDLVHQGCGSVPELAAGLIGCPLWSFWWD